jgi:hypothetical protein
MKKAKNSRPQKMKAYASFADWKRDQSAKHQRLITALSKIVKKTAPEFETFVKWGQGCWILDNAPKVFIHAAEDHLQLGFYAGSRLKDPGNLLIGNGKHVRHAKVFTAKDIRPNEFAAFIKQVK